MSKNKLKLIIISTICIVGIGSAMSFLIYKDTFNKPDIIRSTVQNKATTTSSMNKMPLSMPIKGSIGVSKKGNVNIYITPGKIEKKDTLVNGQVINITGENGLYYQIYLRGDYYYILKSDVVFYQDPYFTSQGEACSLISSSNGISTVLLNGKNVNLPTSSLTKITPGENSFAYTKSYMSINFAFGTNLDIIRKAQEITKGYSTQYEKAQALYIWEATHIRYDFKAYQDELAKNYKELDIIYDSASAIYTFEEQQGICTGYARLYANLCAAVGIPVRTVSGGDHEWNQVNTGNGWFNVDVTWAGGAYYSEDVGIQDHTGAGGFDTSNTQVITNPNYNPREHSTSKFCNKTYAYFNNPIAFSKISIHPQVEKITSQMS